MWFWSFLPTTLTTHSWKSTECAGKDVKCQHWTKITKFLQAKQTCLLGIKLKTCKSKPILYPAPQPWAHLRATKYSWKIWAAAPPSASRSFSEELSPVFQTWLHSISNNRARARSRAWALWRKRAQRRNSVHVTQDVRSESLFVSLVSSDSQRSWRIETGRQLRHHLSAPLLSLTSFASQNSKQFLRIINATQKGTLEKATATSQKKRCFSARGRKSGTEVEARPARTSCSLALGVRMSIPCSPSFSVWHHRPAPEQG